jgi:hypothetical protein
MKKKEMKTRLSTSLACGALLAAWGGPVRATGTELPLRHEPDSCLPLTIETSFGAQSVTLPFTGTTTYHFYSPPLTAEMSLTTQDRGSAVVHMSNTGTSQPQNYAVRGQASYYDYDPVTGTETLIVATSVSGHQDVNYGRTESFTLPNAMLPANITIPAGHLLHLALTISVKSGNPGNHGWLLVNGVSGTSSLGLLPQNAAKPWSFALPPTLPAATITVSSPWVAANSAGHEASIPETAGATCVWSITNGTITAGQGTSQIIWTAGATGPVSLEVHVVNGCASTGSAQVNVAANVTDGLPARIISILALPGGSTELTCSGVAGQTYRIEGTTSLVSPVWVTLGTTNAGANGLFSFMDLDATSYLCRYYRSSAP